MKHLNSLSVEDINDITLERINNVFNNPTFHNIRALFDEDSYITFNMVYFSPISTRYLLHRMRQHGLKSWRFRRNTFEIILDDSVITLIGKLNIVYKKLSDPENDMYTRRIYSFSFDFSIFTQNDRQTEFLCQLEVCMKKLDCMFFMAYRYDIDSIILNRNVSGMLDILTIPLRRINSETKRTLHKQNH